MMLDADIVAVSPSSVWRVLGQAGLLSKRNGSRYIVNWDLRESMTEADIEVILERAKELHPEARPRIISDKWTAVHRQRLQGVHSDIGHDTRQDLALLSSIERKDRTLAQITQGRVHPAANAAV